MQEQTRKTSIDIVESKIPDQLKGLFCEPPLLEADDPEHYWGFVLALIDERSPETASDWIAVHDWVTKLWEERLLRRASNDFVRAGIIRELGGFLAAENGPELTFHSLEDVAQMQRHRDAETQRWLKESASDNPKDRKKIGPLLAGFGTTEAALYAKVHERNSSVLQTFDRMIAAREKSRRKLRNEDELRRRRQERQEMRKVAKE
jgi:hypothetical protein